ncbi:ubiquinone/menaquinone biosynthesis C-methylase UbiE [Alkalicoccobacillus murimartini]|uniref:Ubiquinone/menaquinone biosynthesis C-methylase UbiE n=1 Tax=Alkalicoccobacillus murimartini TaxID=171685 RepID=A0ABT9YD10_9BACI|nr:class I SAM-dependent methyltransferase [Alkalicoccobacillus murimartini]MDQ0205365.1 ubiquinone/menaquinone biosynthesis C-methylase UbiE [Alkalicoccobacillus murimartini]
MFGKIEGKTVLDIGCGSGHSLLYMGSRGASELWGMDLSSKQIEASKGVLAHQKASTYLFESPMEENPGIPHNYFDIVYSIYALGWTVDLSQTLQHINTYLKPGGTFIFSWEHPFHDRITYKDESFVLTKSYNKEGPEWNEAWHLEVLIYHRKLSTYVNTLIENGFMIEKIIDEVNPYEREPSEDPSKWYSSQKAEWIPSTFIIKSKKV